MTALPPAVLDAMRRIDALLQTGELQAAHDQLEAVLENHPDVVEALRLLAGVKQAFGDIDDAEAMLRKALAIDPQWAPTLATLGELLLGRGRSVEAEHLLKRAAQRMPRAAWVLARHYNDSQRPVDAIAILAPMCATGLADTESVTQHVNALVALGRSDEAVAFYRRRVESSRDDLAASSALATALEAASRHAEAERLSRATLLRGYNTAALHFTHARSLISLGAFAAAETALRDTLHLEPRLAEAHNSLARLVWMRTGDAAQTTATLDEALQRFADDDTLWAAKAAVLQGMGDSRGAYACLASQTARKHAAPPLLVRAGLAALAFDPGTALILAQRALHVSPDSMPARNLLVAALLGVGEATDALHHCEILLAHAPDDQYLIALQTTAWRLLGDARYAQYCDYTRLAMSQQLKAPKPWADLTRFLADVKSSLEKLHKPDGHPLLFQSLRNGTETTEDLTRSTDPAIRALFQTFDAPIRAYLAHIGHGNDPLRRRHKGGHRFNGSWSVRLRSSGYHSNHVHPRGWISSACYIDLPTGIADTSNDDGCLAFGEPGMATRPSLRAEHVIRPEAGTLVLFPSYFWHGTVPFHSDETRLTVAFDLLPHTEGRRA